MFALFFSLYVAMFTGSWELFSLASIGNMIKQPLNSLSQLITSTFNNVSSAYTNLGTELVSSYSNVPNWMTLIAFILAIITCIGIVVMAVKGVKKAFGIFFGHIR